MQADIVDLMQQAEQANSGAREDCQHITKALPRREKLKAELAQARERLEAGARRRVQAERDEYERKVEQRAKHSGKRKGKKIKPPDDTPPPTTQNHLTDPDSWLMRNSKNSEYRQSYNAQAAVSADGSQLILSNRVSQCASDRGELPALGTANEPTIGQ